MSGSKSPPVEMTLGILFFTIRLSNVKSFAETLAILR